MISGFNPFNLDQAGRANGTTTRGLYFGSSAVLMASNN